MKNNLIALVVLLVAAVLVLGYALYATFPSTDEVATKVNTLSGVEKTAIDPNILSQKNVSDIENYRIFGTHPVVPDPAHLNRSNPFDGL